ncbi:uncharacterized protein BDZ83DRAFT_649101 [Colletotrichum acutatum]|uniref:Uncharacterized protein n=1 Tax=Glomerella acutata TaxID=27357 RepID=A0AAD8UUG4_GLOAC|nr:uncharacterized protein BDZ83DRAFT_649101 [Colletotrichum acutatum]KAK1727988.1 hypothetical protein BDZ83DRAFT_649101 [Colletotrichum acutatum]
MPSLLNGAKWVPPTSRSSAPSPDTVRYFPALQPIICGSPQTPRADGLGDTRRSPPVISSHPAPARPSHPPNHCQAPFLVALGPVIFARNAEADRGTAAAQAHGQLGGCSTIGGGLSPPPLDDLGPSPKAEVNGEPTAKLVSVPRAKVSGESSRRRNVCNLGDDEILSLRRQRLKFSVAPQEPIPNGLDRVAALSALGQGVHRLPSQLCCHSFRPEGEYLQYLSASL